MTGISIRVEGSDVADAALSSAIGSLDNPMPLYNEIGLAMVRSTQRRFEAETGPAGNPWPPSIRAQFAGGKTLTDTSKLKNSVKHQPDAGGVDIGSNEIYAGIHQKGGTITAKTEKGLRFQPLGRGNGWVTKQSVTIPARPFLGIDAQDETEIAEIVVDYLAALTGGGNAG